MHSKAEVSKVDYSLKAKSSNFRYFALPIVTVPVQISQIQSNPQIQECQLDADSVCVTHSTHTSCIMHVLVSGTCVHTQEGKRYPAAGIKRRIFYQPKLPDSNRSTHFRPGVENPIFAKQHSRTMGALG